MEISSQYENLSFVTKSNYDYVLTNKIGIGKAQSKLSRPLFFLMFTEGCQSILISLLLTELQLQWGITTFQKSLLITLISVGLALGDYVQMYADQTGRLTFIKWNAILQIVFGILSSVATNMNMFIVFRFFYGIGIGITLPLSATYIAEITPTDYRSLFVAKSRVCWAIGCLMTLFLGWYALKQHHWRIMLFVVCIPGIYALWDIYVNGKQSLRYLWTKGNPQKVYQMTTLMCQLNQKPIIPKQQIQHMVLNKNQSQQAAQKQVQYKQIFNDKYCKMTLHLIIAWFSIAFIYYGLFLLFPMILVRSHANSHDMRYIALIAISLFQISVYLFFQKLLESQYFGRRRTLYYNFLVVAACSLALVIYGQSNLYLLIVLFLVMRISIGINILASIPFTLEIYSTLIRSKAMGFFSLMARVGSISIGFFGINSLYWFDGKGLYIIVCLFSFLSFISMVRMPFDTKGKGLS